MPIERTQDKITLRHPKGPSVEILLYGATVISWKSGSQTNSGLTERLFVSSKAALDGSKPVRGGIPVVFPCFGPPTHLDHAKLPQHGFARSEVWNWGEVILDNEAGVSVKLVLNAKPSITAKYIKPFSLAYVVTLAEHQLSTDLHVHNPSPTNPLEFQALFHTYLRVPADNVRVGSLQGVNYYDKTESTEAARATAKQETRSEVDVLKFTDSVYENAPQKYLIDWPQGSLDIKAKGFKDVVVWNPRETGKNIGDMEDGGWTNYVCVEPGYVRGFVNLASEQDWIGQQVITLLS